MDSGSIIRPSPLAQLKVLDKVSPMSIKDMRKNPITAFEDYCVKFSDGHSLWISADSDVVRSLQEREVSTVKDTIFTAPSVAADEDIVVNLEE
jgi:hypothetical protein